MLLHIRLSIQDARLWHVRLMERLAGLPGFEIRTVDAGPAPVSRGLDRFLTFETRLHGLEGPHLFARVRREQLARFELAGPSSPDVTLDLGCDPVDRPGRTWRLFVDGVGGDAGLAGALLAGQRPMVELRDGAEVLAAGRIGTDAHGVVAASLDSALARVVSMLAGVLTGARPQLPGLPLAPSTARRTPTGRDMTRMALKSVARLGLRSVYRAMYWAPHWRVGWRRTDADVLTEACEPSGGWTELPDDGLRFYADPVPFEHNGRLTLFVEEFPHALGKGIISAVPFDDSGPVGRPEPVLERPYHLSYPFVFARDGEHWMIPESGASGTVDLFRATRFPGGWVKERTLIADVVASDATVFEHEGKWWMFATVKDGGSHSDMLCLWSAPHFCGPWTPHPKNPVLIDCVSARPAGRVIVSGGRIFRPTQDCRATYGGALALAEVLQLDDAGFRQDVPAIMKPGPHWPGRHLHTLNRAGGFEFIDGTGKARRQWLPRRAGAPSGPALQASVN